MSQYGTRSVTKKRQEEERRELEGPYHYSEKPTHVLIGGVKEIVTQLWTLVKDVDGMEQSEWTEWTAQGLMKEFTKFRRITGLTLTNDGKIQHLVDSITTYTHYKVEFDYEGERQVRVWVPKQPEPETIDNHLQEEEVEETKEEQEDDEIALLGQRSIDINSDDEREKSSEDEEDDDDSDNINTTIQELTGKFEQQLDTLQEEIDNIDNRDPNSQDQRQRGDMVSAISAITMNMGQALQALQQLEKMTISSINAKKDRAIKQINHEKLQLQGQIKKDLMKDMKQDIQKMMKKEKEDIKRWLQGKETQAFNNMKTKIETEMNTMRTSKEYELDEYKESLILDMEKERKTMEERFKKELEKEKNKFPLPYNPPGAPNITAPFATNVPVANIKHTNMPKSPGRGAKLMDYDKADTYVYEGSKYTIRTQRLQDIVVSLPIIKDKDDIIYVYSALRTAANTCGILITTPDTIKIYTNHRYPTTFGIRSDAETNPSIDFQTSTSLEQLYKTMDRAVFSVLTELVDKEFYEGQQILDNATREGEGYKALYMLLRTCLPRLNRMAAPVMPPTWTSNTELTKFIAKIRAYMEFMQSANFDENAAIIHILAQVPETEYPGVAIARNKYQAYADARENHDIQYGHMQGPYIPLAPQIPGDLRLAYIGYTISKNPVSAVTRRMILEEVKKVNNSEIQATIHVARRTGTPQICKACGNYGHQVDKDGCDQFAIVQNCLKYRAHCKKNKDEETITSILKKHQDFNEEKKKRAQDRPKSQEKPKRNYGPKERKRLASRLADMEIKDDDSDSLYHTDSEDSYDTTITDDTE